MSEAANDYSAWVGRSEESRDRVTASPLDRLAATLDRDDRRARESDAVPPLGHWLFFLPDARQSEIGPDGEVRFSRPPADQRFLEPYSGVYFQVSGEGADTFPSRSLWDRALQVDLDDYLQPFRKTAAAERAKA